MFPSFCCTLPSCLKIVSYSLTLEQEINRLINITELAEGYTQAHCTALMCLHAFTGCDTTSAFKGLGKIKPLKVLQKNPKFAATLSRLGESWEVPEDLIDDLEEFACSMYGRARAHKVNELRYIRIKELCAKDNQLNPSRNLDLGTLPPCRRSLEQHIKRVNYQVGVWKRAHIAQPLVPDVRDGHGWHLVDGKLEPLWFTGSILPQQLIDIIDDQVQSDEDSDDSDPESELANIPDQFGGENTDSDDE